MSDEDKSSKTEEPTDKKLDEARKKGDVPSSKEPGAIAGTVSLFIGMAFLVPSMAPSVSAQLGNLIELAPQISIGTGTAGVADVGLVLESLAFAIIATVAPLFAVMVVAAIAGVLVQGETVVSLERIKAKRKNISPASGLKKIYSPAALVEFLKNTTKVLLIGGIAVWLAWGAISELLPGAVMLPERIPDYIRGRTATVLMIITAVFVPIMIADIIWKRVDWRKKQRMSHKDIKDEHKNAEGSPEMKSKRAQLRFDRARVRMRDKVPTANMILTNPTHYAIALRYERGVDPAPVCVAKGVDLMAGKIREIAREHDIPIVENRSLARALHATVEVDQVIPGEHWEAVAQIVGYVLDLKRKIRRAPPAGSSLRLTE